MLYLPCKKNEGLFLTSTLSLLSSMWIFNTVAIEISRALQLKFEELPDQVIFISLEQSYNILNIILILLFIRAFLKFNERVIKIWTYLKFAECAVLLITICIIYNFKYNNLVFLCVGLIGINFYLIRSVQYSF